MYLLPANRQCSPPPMSQNSRKALLMTFAHQLRDDTARLAHAGAVRRVPDEGPRVSHELCAAILNALTRDDRLRRDYVHRRWLGLIGQAQTANVVGLPFQPPHALRWRAMQRARRPR